MDFWLRQEQQFVVRAAEVTASVEVKYQNIRCTKKEDSDGLEPYLIVEVTI